MVFNIKQKHLIILKENTLSYLTCLLPTSQALFLIILVLTPCFHINWSTAFHPASVPLPMLVLYLESSPSSSLLLAKQKPFLTQSNSCLLTLHMFPREAFLNLARVSCDLRELSSLPSWGAIVSTCNYILISVSLMV